MQNRKFAVSTGILLVFTLIIGTIYLVLAQPPGGHGGPPSGMGGQVYSTAMDYINKHSVSGLFIYKNPADGKIWKLALIEIHPMFKIDDVHYFKHSDWNVKFAPKGIKAAKVDLDFYVKIIGNNITITDVWLDKINGKAVEKTYVCPKHPSIGTTAPLKCPVDGRKLKKTK